MMDRIAKQLKEITKIIEDNPDMWYGCKVGYKAERTRLLNKLKRINQKLKDKEQEKVKKLQEVFDRIEEIERKALEKMGFSDGDI